MSKWYSFTLPPPNSFPSRFLQLKPSHIQLSLSSTAILRIEETGRCREVAAFRGRGRTIYSVRSIWHNIYSDSVPPQMASVQYNLHFSTCHHDLLRGAMTWKRTVNNDYSLCDYCILRTNFRTFLLQNTLYKKYWAIKIYPLLYLFYSPLSSYNQWPWSEM